MQHQDSSLENQKGIASTSLLDDLLLSYAPRKTVADLQEFGTPAYV